jgi:hypothetical protein
VSGGIDNNYTFTGVGAVLTINKALLTATANNTHRAYGISNPTFTISYSGFLGTDNVGQIDQLPIATSSATSLSLPGQYDIVLSTGLDNNYSVASVNGILTVDKAPLTATAGNGDRTYGSANPTFDITYTGFVGTDDITTIDVLPTVSSTATTFSQAGQYPITVTGGSDDFYNFVPIAGVLTIDKATLTATANDAHRPYGQPNPSFDITYTGFLGTDNASGIDVPPTASSVATSLSPLGQYPITLSGGSDNNYTFLLGSGVLTIDQAEQTIQFDMLSDIPASTATILLKASATSGLAVEFTTPSDNVTLNNRSLIIKSPGRITVTANQEGNDLYLPADAVTQTFCANPSKPIVTIVNETNTQATLISNSTTGNQWYLNGSPIADETNKTLIATTPGEYAVKVTVDDCSSDFSNVASYLITAVQPGAEALHLYPNPTQDYVFISGAHSIYDAKLIDAQGKLTIIHFESEANAIKADVRDLSSGIYILEVRQDGVVHHLKLIR